MLYRLGLGGRGFLSLIVGNIRAIAFVLTKCDGFGYKMESRAIYRNIEGLAAFNRKRTVEFFHLLRHHYGRYPRRLRRGGGWHYGSAPRA
jgi:hypothetical protein